MSDGVEVSVNLFFPPNFDPSKRYPVILEMQPYRKDDNYLDRDWGFYDYFIKHGYVMAKADVRGTGSSGGTYPEKEYAHRELLDAEELIDQLSRESWSNGNIGMWGISWSGINSIQVGMRKPPALKAILAACASDDLYFSDTKFQDGVFAPDRFATLMESILVLPKSPDYKLDESYFKERFDQTPWTATMLGEQRLTSFWTEESHRYSEHKLEIPTFLIGNLLDAYRASTMRTYEMHQGYVEGIMGPGGHFFPDVAEPGPQINWQEPALRFWDKWLKPGGAKPEVRKEPMIFFVRTGGKVNSQRGEWRKLQWPNPAQQTHRLFLNSKHRLTENGEKSSTVDTLEYKPDSGIEAGIWWGDVTPDMQKADKGAMVYNSKPLEKSFEIIGIPKVNLRVSADAPQANWIVRLEDVAPDGKVHLVTGGAMNGAQRNNPAQPEALVPGKFYDISIDLHFTTWRFLPRHKIRLSVTNAQFPMFWPSPTLKSSQLSLADSSLDLPVIPRELQETVEMKPATVKRPSHPTFRQLADRGYPYELETTVTPKGWTRWTWKGESNYSQSGVRDESDQTLIKEVDPRNPANARYEGSTTQTLTLPDKRVLKFFTQVFILSDETHFTYKTARTVWENGKLIRTRTWTDKKSRDFQ